MPTRLDPTYTKKQVDDLLIPINARQIERLVFTVNGVFTKATYPWAKYARIICVGSGGGSAGCPATVAGQSSAGQSGGGGGYAEKIVALSTLGANENYIVGLAGAAGASGAAGGAGNVSSFGTVPIVSASGGSGGQIIPAGAYGIDVNGARAPSGVGTLGDILVGGEVTKYSIVLSAGGYFHLPEGASSLLGPGGPVGIAALGASPASGYGGGGGGSTNNASKAARVGVSGRVGCVIVELYG